MASAQPPGTPALGTGRRQVRKPRPGGGSRDSQRHSHAGEEDAALVTTWLPAHDSLGENPETGEGRWERLPQPRAAQCPGRQGSRRLCWGPSALVSSRFSGRTGVLSPFVHSERAGAAEPAGAQCPAGVGGPRAHSRKGHRPSAGLAPEPWRKTRSPSLGFQRGAPALLSHNHTPSPPREGHGSL